MDMISMAFNVFLESRALQILSAIYLLVTAIRTYDLRLLQAKKKNMVTKVSIDTGGLLLPSWVNPFHWIGWIVFVLIIYINFIFAILLFFASFILKTFPVLERIVAVLMRPFLDGATNMCMVDLPFHQMARRLPFPEMGTYILLLKMAHT